MTGSEEEDPVIVFVSKMFPVPRDQLPENRPKPVSAEEMAARREAARKRIEERKNQTQESLNNPELMTQLSEEKMSALKLGNETASEVQEETSKDKTAFVAFARVFSGTLKPGKELYVLGPKYDPQVVLDKLQKGEDVLAGLGEFYRLLCRFIR